MEKIERKGLLRVNTLKDDLKAIFSFDDEFIDGEVSDSLITYDKSVKKRYASNFDFIYEKYIQLGINPLGMVTVMSNTYVDVNKQGIKSFYIDRENLLDPQGKETDNLRVNITFSK